MNKNLLLSSLLLFSAALPGAGKEIPPIKAIQVGKGPDALYLTPDEKFLYVANVEDNFVSIIDLKKEEVSGKIEGINYPWGFAEIGSTGRVAISGYGKQLAMVNTADHKTLRIKTFQENLGGIVYRKSTDKLYVVSTEKKQVLEINPNDFQINKRYDTGDGPDGIGASKDGKKLFVTNTKEGTISVIDTETGKSTSIKTGGKPELVHGTADDSLLFISNFKSNKFHVIETGTGKIVTEIGGLQGPEEIVLDEMGRYLFAVNFNNATVSIFDYPGMSKRTESLKTGKQPIGVIPALKKGKIYVSFYGENKVGVYDSSFLD